MDSLSVMHFLIAPVFSELLNCPQSSCSMCLFFFFFSIYLSFLLFLWCVGEAAPGEAVGEADDYGANEEEEGRVLQLFKV